VDTAPGGKRVGAYRVCGSARGHLRPKPRSASNASWSPACELGGRDGFHEHEQTRSVAHVTSEVMMSERPAEAEDRAAPDHWEGDGFGVIARTKNGPPLVGYGTVTMKNAVASTMKSCPSNYDAR
jgi:hypothetical protein